MPKSPAKIFKATLKPDSTSLKWTVVSVPRSITDAWKTGRPRVKGEINGVPFRTTLFSTGKGDFLLLVNKRMQTAAKVVEGCVASFSIEPDVGERTVLTPPELKKAMTGAAPVRKYFEALPYSVKKYIADLIAKPQSADARDHQAERMAEVLFAMTEGERETPPILEAAFARNPQAKQGWQRMTPVQRRGHLWGIFYYISPESRQKRTNKAVAECVSLAKRKATQPLVAGEGEEL